MPHFRLPRILLSICAAALFAPVAHASALWNFDTGCTEQALNAGNFGNMYVCSAGAGNPTVALTAWANTGSGATFDSANLKEWSGNGFGIKNQVEGLNATSPNHSIDNKTNTDAILLGFAQSVALDQVKIGWAYNDTDVSVLRYKGSSAPVMTGKTIAQLLADGWEDVGNYADLQSGVTKNVNPSDKTSSWWLFSAYNSAFLGNTAANLTGNYDYLKLLAIAATPTPPPVKIPEPGSLALAAIALGGLLASRRNRRKTP